MKFNTEKDAWQCWHNIYISMNYPLPEDMETAYQEWVEYNNVKILNKDLQKFIKEFK